MDETTPTPTQSSGKTLEVDQQMLLEIYENSRKAKEYMKWQLIITIALVVIPLLAALIIVPLVFSSLAGLYGSTSGLLQ